MRNHQIEVHRNIVPIVPGGEGILGPNQLNINHLGAGTIKILLFHIVPGPYFPAFYRSICSRIPIFVVQTKGSEECSNGLHRRSIRQTLQTTRLGKPRTKSLRTRQSDSSILNKNRECFRNPIKFT